MLQPAPADVQQASMCMAGTQPPSCYNLSATAGHPAQGESNITVNLVLFSGQK